MTNQKNGSIFLPSNIGFKYKNNKLILKGPLGIQALAIPKNVYIHITNKLIFIKTKNKSLKNLVNSLIRNKITSVVQGFLIKIILTGTGYKVRKSINNLEFTLGYSHVINYQIPDNIFCNINSDKSLTIFSINQDLLKQNAYKIQSYKRSSSNIKFQGLSII